MKTKQTKQNNYEQTNKNKHRQKKYPRVRKRKSINRKRNFYFFFLLRIKKVDERTNEREKQTNEQTNKQKKIFFFFRLSFLHFLKPFIFLNQSSFHTFTKRGNGNTFKKKIRFTGSDVSKQSILNNNYYYDIIKNVI